MKQIKEVSQIYDVIVNWFDAHRNKDLVFEKGYLDVIQKYIPAKCKVLDVGCGTGEPMARFFIENGYDVTGIDASKKMIELCKQRFPNKKWIFADMRNLHLEEKFHAVIAWHSLFHLTPTDQKTTLRLLTKYVRKKGLLVFTSGWEYGETWSDNGGEELYHASLSTADYSQILSDNHFEILIHKVKDPVCGGATVWIAQRG